MSQASRAAAEAGNMTRERSFRHRLCLPRQTVEASRMSVIPATSHTRVPGALIRFGFWLSIFKVTSY